MSRMQDNTANKEIAGFDPDASAAMMKLRIKSYERITAEIVAELYRAQEYYSNQGFRSDLVSGETRLRTFEAYLSDVGLAKPTAYRWLERYIPEENKLLTYEELSDKKAAEARAKLSEEERQRSMIAEFRKTGIKPAGWTPKLDKAVKDTDEHLEKIKVQREKEEAQRQQRAADYKAKQESDKTYTLHHDMLSDALKTAADALHQQNNLRTEWKEKIRLSDGGKEDAFMDAIIDYMETLSDDNRRIEACNNIIKICRNISVELQNKNTMK